MRENLNHPYRDASNYLLEIHLETIQFRPVLHKAVENVNLEFNCIHCVYSGFG